MRAFSTDLSLGAQTAYAELFDAAQVADLAPFAALKGSFQKRMLKGREYVYFTFPDADGTGRNAYIGPNNKQIQRLEASYLAAHASGQHFVHVFPGH